MLVKDVLKDVGIISLIHKVKPLPAIDDYQIDVDSLDRFFILKYGNRHLTELAEFYIKNNDINLLAKTLSDVYNQKWNKYFENMSRNLITDVDFTITETLDGTTDNVENIINKNDSKRSDKEYSYNEDTAINSEESTTTGNNLTDVTGKKTDKRTKTTTHKGVNGGKIRDSISVSRYLENIYFHEIVLKDVANNITLKIY